MRCIDRPSVRLLCAVLALLSGLLAAQPGLAQAWPARPLRLIVPLAPGVQPDLVARALAQELSTRLGQPVLVENRPGAQTNIGMEAVARAAPDGYTLLFALTSLAINPHMQKVGFDPLADFVPVAPVARTQFVLVSSLALPAASVDELIAYARERPDGVRCAHSGGATQLACALFALLARANVVQVPYRSNALALGDLARGDVHIMFDSPSALPLVRAAHGRALAATGVEPFEQLPRLSDKLPGFEINSWQGVLAPAATPAAIVRRLNAAIGAALAAPDVVRQFTLGSAQPMAGSPEEFGEFLRREHARYGRIVRDAELRAE